MTRMLIAVATVAGLCAWASPHAQSPANAPGATAPRAADASAAADGNPPRREAATRDASAAGADPRVCLEFGDNLQVHRCAEKYRPHRRAA